MSLLGILGVNTDWGPANSVGIKSRWNVETGAKEYMKNGARYQKARSLFANTYKPLAGKTGESLVKACPGRTLGALAVIASGYVFFDSIC